MKMDVLISSLSRSYNDHCFVYCTFDCIDVIISFFNSSIYINIISYSVCVSIYIFPLSISYYLAYPPIKTYHLVYSVSSLPSYLIYNYIQPSINRRALQRKRKAWACSLSAYNIYFAFSCLLSIFSPLVRIYTDV